MEESFTWIIAKLSTDNHGIIYAPRVITDSAPPSSRVHLNTAFIVSGPTNKTYVDCRVKYVLLIVMLLTATSGVITCENDSSMQFVRLTERTQSHACLDSQNLILASLYFSFYMVTHSTHLSTWPQHPHCNYSCEHPLQSGGSQRGRSQYQHNPRHPGEWDQIPVQRKLGPELLQLQCKFILWE